jgi:hypothetical protein
LKLGADGDARDGGPAMTFTARCRRSKNDGGTATQQGRFLEEHGPAVPATGRAVMTARDVRTRVLEAVALHGCGYVDQDTITAVCPVCKQGMAVRFIGETGLRLTCPTGCGEAEIAEALGLRGRAS